MTCYHLTPDTWYLTLVNWHAITYLTCFHMVQVHLTWCCDTWLGYYYTWLYFLFMIITFTGDLAWLLYCYQTFGTPELLCSWTPVYLNPWNREAPDITPDIILLLTPKQIIMDDGLLYSLWTLSLNYIYNKVLNLYLGGRNWWIPIWCLFIMVIFLKCHVGRVMISPKKQ